MDNSVTPVEGLIDAGLTQRFYTDFKTPLLLYNGPDVKKTAVEHLKKKALPLYPFAVAKATNWAISETNYKPNTLLRRGIKSRATMDNVLCYELNMIPVTTTYEVSYYCQTFPEVQAFGKAWMMAAVRSNLSFSITYAVADIDIKLVLDRNVSVPSREAGATEVKEYIAIVNFTLMGYMSDQLKTSQAVTDLSYELALFDQIGQAGGTITLFTSDYPKPSTTTNMVPGTDYLPALQTIQISVPSSLWTINHTLDHFPTVTALNANGVRIEGQVHYPSASVVLVQWTTAQTGTVYLS